MFNSNILDVAIGLIFVFLTLSLVCSAANEGIESFLKQRAKNLEKGIRELLGDLPESLPSDLEKDAAGLNSASDPPPPASIAAAINTSADKPKDFIEAFYNHGLINSLYRGKYGDTPRRKLPSYIPAANFAMAVLDLRRTGAVPLPRNLRAAIDIFEMKARGDVFQLQRELENWYDSSMDRVSGWYKRKTQMILVGLGLVAAVAVNADTIEIAQRLSTDSNLRQSVARIAEEAVKHPPQGQLPQTPVATTPATPAAPPAPASPVASQPDPVTQIRTNLASLDGIGLPLGWQGFKADFLAKKAAQAKAMDLQGKTPETESRLALYSEAGVAAVKLHWIGWIVTALAISLGAPFWFDMLNKFMVVRSTVKPKEKSKEEASKDPTLKK